MYSNIQRLHIPLRVRLYDATYFLDYNSAKFRKVLGSLFKTDLTDVAKIRSNYIRLLAQNGSRELSAVYSDRVEMARIKVAAVLERADSRCVHLFLGDTYAPYSGGYNYCLTGRSLRLLYPDPGTLTLINNVDVLTTLGDRSKSEMDTVTRLQELIDLYEAQEHIFS